MLWMCLDQESCDVRLWFEAWFHGSKMATDHTPAMKLIERNVYICHIFVMALLAVRSARLECEFHSKMLRYGCCSTSCCVTVKRSKRMQQ